MKLLLVEDNPGDRRLFEEYVREFGGRGELLRLTSVATVDAATEALARESFDVAFLDLGLPGTRGLEALTTVRDAAPSLPIIILTSRDEEETSLAALEHGAQDYILKEHLPSQRFLQSIRFAIQRKRTEESLRRRERELHQVQRLQAIGQLAAGVAHEINTPMQYIGDNVLFLKDAMHDIERVLQGVTRVLLGRGTSQGVDERDLDALAALSAEADIEYLLAEIPRALEQSGDGVERVTRIVRAMKEFSHPGTQERQLLDLARGLESTLTVCRNEWKYIAEVELDVAADLPAVPCYAADMNQVFLNLIVNAAHAIAEKTGDAPGEKGTIRITARQLGDHVEVRFQDDGTGIPEAVRPRILEPFFTTKEVGKGTGQGLSFAYSVVVEKHDGTLTFETEVGRGTVFVVRLPLVPAVRAAAVDCQGAVS